MEWGIWKLQNHKRDLSMHKNLKSILEFPENDVEVVYRSCERDFTLQCCLVEFKSAQNYGPIVPLAKFMPPRQQQNQSISQKYL